jgi:hypothetical protein
MQMRATDKAIDRADDSEQISRYASYPKDPMKDGKLMKKMMILFIVLCHDVDISNVCYLTNSAFCTMTATYVDTDLVHSTTHIIDQLHTP